jgi:subtilisin family serine protease
MLRDDTPRNSLRASPFEEFEERLALSAQALTALLGSNLDRQAVVALEQPALLAGDVSTQGNVGSQWSDVNYVRSNYGLTGAGQTVAIIDSGIAYDHVALGGGYGAGHRVVGGWDFAENDANPYDDAPAGFHGTHVAGIVGANSTTYPGLAPGVDLVSLRVFDDNGSGQFAWIEQALQWVEQHRTSFANPITTVNLSIGMSWNSDSVPSWANLEDEFAALKSEGLVITVSAGNSFAQYNAPGVSYPAASPYVIAAASVDANGNISSFSQRSAKVLAAPGQSIMSTVPDYLYSHDGVPNDYASATGTSMAAPYVAGASVLVRQAMQQAGYTTINEDTIYNVLKNTADSVYDSVTHASYSRINLKRAIDTVENSVQQSPAWGNVDFFQTSGRQATGDTSYAVTATHTGIFTAEAIFNNAAGNVDIEVRDANNNLLGSSATTSNNERVDVNVTAGQQLFVHVLGTNSNVMFRCTNLVSTSGSTVNVAGTSGDDLFVFLPGQGGGTNRIAVNGVGYNFSASQFNTFNVAGGGGTDTVVGVGTTQNETASLWSGGGSLSSASYSFNATGVDNVTFSGGGGTDTATLYDSAGNDRFIASPTGASMTGAGYSLTVTGFETVNGNFSNGGFDQSFLYGSIGDDHFTASSTTATLQGPGYVINTSGYDTVVAVGGYGNDLAQFSDTSGNETFIGDPNAGSLSGNGFYLRAENFDRVEATSSGGDDVAYLWDSAGDDAFAGSQVLAYLNGSGFSNFVQGFGHVTAFSRSGVDSASLYGTSGVDWLTANNGSLRLSANDYAIATNNFRNAQVYGNGGNDAVWLQELDGNDLVRGRAAWFSLSDADSLTGYGFEQVTAIAKTGATPQSDVQAVDYLFTKSNW